MEGSTWLRQATQESQVELLEGSSQGEGKEGAMQAAKATTNIGSRHTNESTPSSSIKKCT